MQLRNQKVRPTFESLPGLTGYEEARALQQELLEKRVRDEIPDTFLLLEHHSVITRGRGLQFTGEPRPRHMPVPVMLPPGVEFAESERGGDLTWHGPGQLVIYPIVKLDGRAAWAPNHDISGFLRAMEQWLSRTLAGLGLQTEARADATGVWVLPPEGVTLPPAPGGARKIASIGIAVRKWVTWHGIAINLVNDLEPFRLISPCGFQPEVMTRLRDLAPSVPELQEGPDGTAWRAWFESKLGAALEG